jgi:hypothetical protein
MSWKQILVAPVLAALICLAVGCGHAQPGNTVHGTKDAFKKMDAEKGK